MSENWGATLGELSSADGSSKTILFAEVRAGLAKEDIRGTWALGFIGASVIARAADGDALVPNARNDNADDAGPGCLSSETLAGGGAQLAKMGLGCHESRGQATARSQHTGGVLCCFSDGSVQFVTDNIDTRNWFRALGSMDGEVYTPQ